MYLDLEAEFELKNEALDTLCWVFIKLKIERDDGLSHDDEFEDLGAYEDELVSAIDSSKTVYIGRITTQGMRQFYFYSSDVSLFEKQVTSSAGRSPNYLYQIGNKFDPNWDQYKTVLYPGKHGLQQISARSKNA